ncbi:PREDICTED: probable RNA-binding protein ARP1 isoform X2 [Tarenaya hassleriana]|uniref:probable RNA-binding protein ARP1 isoform X2 n=1 Tax=Tarenaya hassleriana TaxID=28532 RepID=UPI00053C2AF7|nr:PREDICTED: probable RNA-binding protein ARP1 isoform X2 [Tarenaya hassleriana]
MTTMTASNNVNGQFGDTTLTKVFVGGLAWETPKEAMREHFDKYGEILEAVIISDKITGRSKGYGFVTFKEADAAKRACEDPTPIINGRRANCNLASLGARPRRSLATQQGSKGGNRATSARVVGSHVQMYYPAGFNQPHHQPQHPPVTFYGYPPTYIAPDMGFNNKMVGGAYMNGHYVQQQHYGQVMVRANAMVPVFYQPYHHHSHVVGLPPPPPAPILSKPLSFSPLLSQEQLEEESIVDNAMR